MNKTYVETFKDMVNMMLNKESFTSDLNSVNSVYMGNIALSLSAIADELHELNENLKRMSCSDPVPSKNEQEEHGTETHSEPEYKQPEFAFNLMIDATTIISLMYDTIKTKGYVTVADAKRFADVDGSTEIKELDNLYGWYEIDPFDTLEVCDFKNVPPTRYLLKLPPVERIKELK